MHTTTTTHRTHTISTLHDISARLCGCGVIHLNIGPMSLNLTEKAALGIAQLLLKREADAHGTIENVVQLSPKR